MFDTTSCESIWGRRRGFHSRAACAHTQRTQHGRSFSGAGINRFFFQGVLSIADQEFTWNHY